MNAEPPQQTYHYRILQRGTLPLSPEGAMDISIEHRCTSVVIWPAGESPLPARAIFTDPCFTTAGKKEAQKQVERIGLTLNAMRLIFVTHRHRDHLPTDFDRDTMHIFQTRIPAEFPGLTTERCPGHAPDLHALIFRNIQEKIVWVVGDAILNRAWMLAWGYFWPNKYSRDEIAATWRSVAKIVANADIVIPGHGDEIRMTPDVVEKMLNGFLNAPCAEMVPDVAITLRERLQRFKHAAS